MSASKEKANLVEDLSKHLGWDITMTSEIVEALVSKSSAADRSEIIEVRFMVTYSQEHATWRLSIHESAM